MQLNKWLLVAAVASVLSSVAHDPAGHARAPGGDWKFYGGVSSPNGQTWCFFDAKGIAREPDSLVRVPAKCLPQTDMDDIDAASDLNGVIERNAARKRHGH